MSVLEPDLSLYALASNVLSAVEARYPTTGDLALPTRRYVSDGQSAHDICDDDAGCGQVTVWVARVLPISGNVTVEQPTAMRFEAGRAAEVQLQVIRSVPVIGEDGGTEPPTAAEIEASAVLVLADAEMVPQAIRQAYRAGELPGCSGVAFLGWASYGPSGGAGGGTVTMRLEIE